MIMGETLTLRETDNAFKKPCRSNSLTAIKFESCVEQ